jgi:hypothetical protein
MLSIRHLFVGAISLSNLFYRENCEPIDIFFARNHRGEKFCGRFDAGSRKNMATEGAYS